MRHVPREERVEGSRAQPVASPLRSSIVADGAPFSKRSGTLAAIGRIGDRVASTLEVALAVAFIAAVCLNFANVIGRYVVGESIFGADEMQVFVLVWMAFLGAAIVAWRGQVLRMDVLARRFPPSLRALLEAAELAVVAILAAFVCVRSSLYVAQVFAFGQVSDLAEIPMWIPHGAVAVGFGLIALINVFRLIAFVASLAAAHGGAGR
jgi:TRAP-type C4-dicarboxylate transport system permease small subunit